MSTTPATATTRTLCCAPDLCGICTDEGGHLANPHRAEALHQGAPLHPNHFEVGDRLRFGFDTDADYRVTDAKPLTVSMTRMVGGRDLQRITQRRDQLPKATLIEVAE